MSKPTSVDEQIKEIHYESISRFKEAGYLEQGNTDDVVAKINRLILEKRIEDLKHIFRQYSQITDPDYIHIVKHSKIDRRIKKLTKELGDSNER